MPVALVIVLLDITLVYHAAKTGRLQPWAFIILMIPLVGAFAYIAVELIPEWFGSPGAQQARRRVAAKLDPEKRYRELSDRLPGAEARVRYGMLLKLVGRTAEARVIFNELLIQMRRTPKHARDMQAEWLAIAEKQLSA